MAAGGVVGEDRVVEQPADALTEGSLFAAADQFGHGRRHLVGQRRDLVQPGVGHGLAGEIPDHGAQHRLEAEAQPVVDAPDAVVVVKNHVA